MIEERQLRVFTRTWWMENAAWPNGLEPCAGKKRTIGWASSQEEARTKCAKWNSTHNPGRYSLKAEFEDA